MGATIIPLQLLDLEDNGFHLLVEVVAFGQSFNAVVDTGASKTVFDKTITGIHAPQAELIVSDKLSTGLGTNTMESHTCFLPVLQIGKLRITNFEVAVLDLSAITHAYESLNLPPVIGVLGGDILTHYQAIINYKALKLRLNLRRD